MTLAVVHENPGTASHRIDQQVQIAVSVDVGEDGARRILASATDSGGVRDIFKLAVAEIAEKFVVVAVETAQIDITQAVAVHITERNPRTVQQILVGDRSCIGNKVGKGDPGGFRLQECETGLADLGHGQFAPTIALSGLPIQPAAFSYTLRQEQGPKGKLKQCVCDGALPIQKTFHWRSTLIFPSTSTSISRAPAGIEFVVVLPPAHRTQSCVGAWGVPSTSTAPSCDQYPDPA